MKLSLDWLSDFVDTSGVSPQKLAELLTERVAEVEHITTFGGGIAKVVVGEILKIEPVEGADKIQLTTVDIGTEKLAIVCGAANISEGAKVPVACVGAVLPGNFKIEKRKMRGVESCGMICSESELGIKEKSEGILLLPADAKVGEPFRAETADTILEIDNHAITHRPDLFGQLGFAREVALLLDRKFHEPPLAPPKFDGKLDVEVADSELCPRYSALRVSGIEVQPSSSKIRARLESCGIQAINNVVDATNYVLLELGQPLHAFDSKLLSGGWLVVRRAKAGEKIQTLDGTDRELNSEILVIADAEKPLALAGVMGGANSEISEKTQEITLEAANFDATNIRRTSQKFALRSESSLRFEKRLDPELPPRALARCLEILRESCPNLQVEAGRDVVNFAPEQRQLKLSPTRLAKKLGAEVPADRIEKILTALGFGVEKMKAEKPEEIFFDVSVPSFRAGRDIEQPDDLIEEVVRHIGYTDLPTEFPWVKLAAPEINPARELADEIRDAMVGFGFHETYTLALVSEKLLQKVRRDVTKSAQLQNPPNEDYRFLRPSLVASLLAAAEKNIRTTPTFRLFEIAEAFGEKAEEWQLFAALIVGEKSVFRGIRGVLEQLLPSLRLPAEFAATVEVAAIAHPGRTADVKIAGHKVGMLAELHPAVARDFDLPHSAFFCLDFDRISALPRSPTRAHALPKFPGVPRDIAIVVPARSFARDVENAIAAADKRICELQLFDVYEGDKIPTGMKSLAFSFEIRDPTKTLTDDETEKIFAAIVTNVEKAGGKLRE